ncbi:major facilitator family transporter [Actinobaculum suis]|uniref:Major facilitator family transporter n=1 Tax=Actinobaculum suis TaxID=1657 RepID=A0A7Z9C930_9ACTO|nr:MFS transporter [Actinobaculum suis]VDG77182.1 major facilitator family transporter [Actinobaculum suis]
MSSTVDVSKVNETALIRKLMLRIIPFIMVLYTIAYIDRSVVGFAKLQMSVDIGLTESAYGLGAGLFFLGYFIFEVPSNYVLPKFGPRKWFARILVTWGLVTMATALTPNTTIFYILRFLLGVSEAGFYPGVLYYITLWFPQRHRTRATGMFVMAAPLAFLIMNPLAGWLLDAGWLGLRGWHWMFIICGGAAVIAAIPTLFLLHDTPREAPWISEAEATWIETELEKDKNQLGQVEHKNPLAAMGSKYVWAFAFIFLPTTIGVYGLSFWVPSIVAQFADSGTSIGFYSTIPYLFGILGIWVTSHWASRFKENWIPLTVIFLGAALGTGLAGWVESPAAQLAAMSLAAFCLYSLAGVFWPLPTRYLVGATAAIGIAFINSFGNLGGFIGPYLVGAISDATGSPKNGMYFIAAVLVVGALLTLWIKHLWAGQNPEELTENTETAAIK